MDAAAFAGSNRFGRVSRALQVEKLLILHGIQDCDIDMLLISCDMLLCRQSDTALTRPVDTDRWEERVQEAEQRKAVRTFAQHSLCLLCV